MKKKKSKIYKSKDYKRNQARKTRFVKKFRKLFTPRQRQGNITK